MTPETNNTSPSLFTTVIHKTIYFLNSLLSPKVAASDATELPSSVVAAETTQHYSKPFLIVTAQPNDINPKGDVFGGWLLSHLDVAGAICATQSAKAKVATVAVKEMQFRKPLFIRDIVSLYADVERMGKTSITVKLTAYADRDFGEGDLNVLIADATFVYVAIESPGIKQLIED
jgi:acyl-CoA thioesterase YciA